MKRYLLRFFLCICLASITIKAYADLNVVPDDLPKILNMIGKIQSSDENQSRQSAKLKITDGEISFLDKSGERKITSSFSDQNTTIIRHIRLGKVNQDGYSFQLELDNKGSPFKSSVSQINGQDALVFYNDDDVFVYTQTIGDNDIIELKEWIYARHTNCATGSCWKWTFKADPMQWPLTLNMDEKGETSVYRNVPTPPGMTINSKARSNYMLQLTVHPVDDVQKVFPFKELLVSMPKPKSSTMENIPKQVDVKVSNISINNPNRPKPKHGLDFDAWDDHWQSNMEISIQAKPEEYPLLVNP